MFGHRAVFSGGREQYLRKRSIVQSTFIGRAKGLPSPTRADYVSATFRDAFTATSEGACSAGGDHVRGLTTVVGENGAIDFARDAACLQPGDGFGVLKGDEASGGSGRTIDL